MDSNGMLGKIFLKELEAEAPASRKCLERIPMDLSSWKPHEKSMQLGYLALLVADIPRWIRAAAEIGEVDFATWKQPEMKTTTELVNYFDENMKAAGKALQNTSDKTFSEMFYLKDGGQVLMSSTRGGTIGSSINHLVHHRGQLTVYMRLNNIPVPSIYGPSADERTF